MILLVGNLFLNVGEGLIKPIVYTFLPITEAEEAQNIMYRGKNAGKVVLKVNNVKELKTINKEKSP